MTGDKNVQHIYVALILFMKREAGIVVSIKRQ